MFSEKAKWISCGEEFSSPIVVKQITLHSFKKAQIDICGLGYYELFINGIRVGDEFFKPVFSDYSHRDFSSFLYPLNDKTSHSIYYNTIDVSDYFKEGENVISVMLGNGFYRQTERIIEGNTKFGDSLILCYHVKVEEENGVKDIFTDGSEKVRASFITNNNLFYGETHDYSIGLDVVKAPCLSGDKDVSIIPNPDAKYFAQSCPNDRIISKIEPVFLFADENGFDVYDVGQNISGFVLVESLGGDIEISHAENVSNGMLDYVSAGGADQISKVEYKNTYNGQIVHPYFCWSGFRYFQVKGKVKSLKACIVHSNVKVTAKIESDNKVLNWLFNTFIQTQLNNMHGGVPSDCPHRERLGYTGDGQLCCESALLTLDSKKFYEKWLRDIADCQDVQTGHVQHTAPFCGGGGGPGGWGGAIVIVTYTLYKLFGDKKILLEYLPNVLRYLECMETFSENGLIVKEREKGWCLGDWCTPDTVKLPEPFVNTYYYVKCMEMADYMLNEVGKEQKFTLQIEKCKQKLVEKYYNKKKNSFCDNVQGANVFALDLGLGNQKMFRHLIKEYSKEKCFNTGIFGTDVLTKYLSEKGEIQLLFDLLSSEKYPSFGYMMNKGATTLWEDWKGEFSHDHPMFGGCVKQIVYGILGVSFDVGCNNIVIAPKYINGIKKLKCELILNNKKVQLNYEYSKKGLLGEVYSELPFSVFNKEIKDSQNSSNFFICKK